MPMPPYAIHCLRPNCGRPAVYKIAARWSDGVTSELKTYDLCCAPCLPDCFGRSLRKQKDCRLAPHEILEAPGIYLLERGQRDRRLRRLSDLEEQLAGSYTS
jgi:hypothetical protein